MKNKVVAALLASLAILGTCPVSYAATEHYADGSVIGSDGEWDAWVEEWETVANDYTQVSITPGADETQLNFAWYSEKTDAEATPVVHF